MELVPYWLSPIEPMTVEAIANVYRADSLVGEGAPF